SCLFRLLPGFGRLWANRQVDWRRLPGKWFLERGRLGPVNHGFVAMSRVCDDGIHGSCNDRDGEQAKEPNQQQAAPGPALRLRLDFGGRRPARILRRLRRDKNAHRRDGCRRRTEPETATTTQDRGGAGAGWNSCCTAAWTWTTRGRHRRVPSREAR